MRARVTLLMALAAGAVQAHGGDAAGQHRRRPHRPHRPSRPHEPAPAAPAEPAEPGLSAAPVAVAQPAVTPAPGAVAPASAELPVAPAELPVALARPRVVDAALGFRLFQRHLSFHDDLFGQFRSYDLAAAPSLSLAVEYFPGAHFTSNPLAHIGLLGAVDYAFGVSSVDGSGQRFGTTALGYSIGLRGRIPVGLSDFGPVVAYGGQVFAIERNGVTQSGDAGIPGVGYQYLRLGATARFGFIERLSLLASGAYLAVFDGGEVTSARYFHRATVGAVEASVAVSVGLAAGFEARLGVDMRRYFYAMNPEVGDPYVVGGALDIYYGATAAIAFRR